MQTLVNRAERIVMPPRKDGTAYALAWEDGKKVEEMERVKWLSAGVDKITGKNKFAWMSINSIDGVQSIWRTKDNVFSFTSLASYKAEQDLL